MNQFWKQWEGQVVDGSFTLQQCLGAGDRHAVYLTERNGQQAAIKLVRSDPLADQFLPRWQASSRLSHPHLMRLFNFGRCEFTEIPMLFVVTEYAEENLAQVIAQRALSADEVKDVLPPTLSVLGYLHQKGFVHSDLKPSNFLAVDGQLRISSDMLCRSGEGFAQEPGAYAAPEIRIDGFSPASDVWSLGMTLAESLTRQMPKLDASGKQTKAAATIPAQFSDLVQHCLRHDPAQRWTLREINKWLKAGDVQAQQTTESRSLTWLYLSTAALALILAGVIVWPILDNPRPEAPGAPSIALEQPKILPKAEAVPAEVAALPSPPPIAVPETPPVVKATPAPVKEPKPAAVAETPSADGVVERVIPDVPASARSTIQGKVSVAVKVEVDPSGKVVEATLDSPGPSKYFSDIALKTSSKWRFAAGPAPQSWILQYRFMNRETQVTPVKK